jgi:hypothetical protein
VARLGREATDEEIVEADQHGDDALILPSETWEAVRDRVADLLDAAEVDGVAGAIDWLDRRGLRWIPPTDVAAALDLPRVM